MAFYEYCDSVDEVVVPVSETWYCGNAKLTNNGRVGIVTNMHPVVAGQTAAVRYRGQVSFPATVAFAAGVDVYVNTTTQVTAAAAGAGLTLAGRSLKAATLNDPKGVMVDLNP